MRVVQSVFGVFHHFELARELGKRGHLERIYSTWPWQRVQREGLPRDRVETFPWIHAPAYFLGRVPGMPVRRMQDLQQWNARAFDQWCLRRVQRLHTSAPLDALIALSGSGTQTGVWLQQQGGSFVCDRGSTHHRFQTALLAEEFRLWGLGDAGVDPRDTATEERQYELADAITVPSRAAAQSFLQMGVPAEKLHVIPYGVNLARFAPGVGPREGSFDVLFAGTVSLRKGIPYLLQAFAALRHPAKRLRLAGPVEAALRPLLPKLPTDGVEFLGHLPTVELAAQMSRSHVLVLPSIEDGFGMVMTQAMACGCPVIASENTGGPDLITEGLNGFVVPIRDARTLADRMQRLADDPALQKSMRVEAVRRVTDDGGWTEYGSRWERLLLALRQGRS